MFVAAGSIDLITNAANRGMTLAAFSGYLLSCLLEDALQRHSLLPRPQTHRKRISKLLQGQPYMLAATALEKPSCFHIRGRNLPVPRTLPDDTVLGELEIILFHLTYVVRSVSSHPILFACPATAGWHLAQETSPVHRGFIRVNSLTRTSRCDARCDGSSTPIQRSSQNLQSATHRCYCHESSWVPDLSQGCSLQSYVCVV